MTKELENFSNKIKRLHDKNEVTLQRFGKERYYQKIEPSLLAILRQEVDKVPEKGDYQEQRRLVSEIARAKAGNSENFLPEIAALLQFLPFIMGNGNEAEEARRAAEEAARKQEEEAKRRQLLYIGGAVIAVVILIVILAKTK